MIARIGIFDSGLGGFTVLNRLLGRYGDLFCLYLADTARVPFGERSITEIRIIAGEIIEWLSAENISAVVIGCNTTNSLAFDVIKKGAGVPVFGLIEAAAGMVIESRVGVLATPATAASNAYRDQIEAENPGTTVYTQACPAFVPLIEGGEFFTEKTFEAANQYLKPLLDAEVEAIVLGCSHYPLLEPLLRELLPQNIRLVDPAIGLCSQLDDFVGIPALSDLVTPSLYSNTRFCVTSNPVGFASRAAGLIGNSPEVELISLRTKACLS